MAKVRALPVTRLSDGYDHATRPEDSSVALTPDQVEFDRLKAEIWSSPARTAILYWMTKAQALGLDSTDPETLRRAIRVGVEEHARNVESAVRMADYSALRASQRAAKRHSPVVYYMRMSDLVKIGVSTAVGRRMSSIGAQGVMAVEPGAYVLEGRRHEQFGHLHDHGEWFRMAPELGAHIADVRERFEVKMGVTTEAWLVEWLPRRRPKRSAGRTVD